MEPLFDRALDLAGAERRDFLQRVRERNASLALKLGQLLEAAEGAEGVIIDRSLAEVAGDLIERIPMERVTGLRSGTRIGRYRVLEELGHGGMGRVLLAAGSSPEPVAIKVMTAGDPQWAERFQREQQILKGLDHPSFVPVLDQGVTEHGYPYFVMPYIDGLPVTDHCRVRQLGTVEVLRVLDRLLDAVAAAHRRRIVHRDLKPSNVLVASIGGVPTPCVLDFGVARENDATDLTFSGQIMGTAGYMSPEQAVGDRTVDHRSDQFSLGVLAYELLAGVRPFRGDSMVETQMAVLRSEPAPLVAVRPSIPDGVSRAVARSLEKDRDRRFPDLDGLRAALAAALD